MERCNCNPVPEKFEFEIPILPIITTSTTVLPKREQDLAKLKLKIICDYYDILNKLECGIQPDLLILLEEISLIETYE